MNKSVYGHVKAKDKILQIISQWISNPDSKGNIIALQGPPGMVKQVLSKMEFQKLLIYHFYDTIRWCN